MAYGTRKSIVLFTTTLLSLSWVISTQFLLLPPIYLIFIIIFLSYRRLGLPKEHFPVGLTVNILKALLPSSILANCLALLNLLDLIIVTILGEEYQLWSSSLWSLLHSSFSSLLGPNFRLRVLFPICAEIDAQHDTLQGIEFKIAANTREGFSLLKFITASYFWSFI